jgi:hypothetical protein
LRNILGMPPADSRRIVPVTAPVEMRLEPDWESSLAQMLSSQNEQFTAAIPAGLSEILNRSGFFDRIDATPTTDSVDTAHGTTTRASAPLGASAPSSSMHWAYWAIPLAALVGLGWYFLSGDWSRRDQVTRTTETGRSTTQPMKAVPLATENDIGRQLTEAINSLRTSLQA